MAKAQKQEEERPEIKLKVEIDKKAKELVVRVPLICDKKGNIKPRPSRKGTTLLVATSGGNKEVPVQVFNQNLRVGVNAYIYPE